jgi:putative ABC transport system substrate-binding protein
VSDSSLGGLRDQIVALAARHAVPAIYDQNYFVEAGGLISYRGVSEELMHDAGVYVGRILKGEKPTDLPVLQPTKFDLIYTSRLPRRSASLCR